jgi:hypothetical protein
LGLLSGGLSAPLLLALIALVLAATVVLDVHARLRGRRVEQAEATTH